MTSRARLMIVAALAGLGIATLPEVGAATRMTVSAPNQREKRQRELARYVGSVSTTRRKGPGWTRAHVQRMAKKARNQRRNRAAHR